MIEPRRNWPTRRLEISFLWKTKCKEAASEWGNSFSSEGRIRMSEIMKAWALLFVRDCEDNSISGFDCFQCPFANLFVQTWQFWTKNVKIEPEDGGLFIYINFTPTTKSIQSCKKNFVYSHDTTVKCGVYI